MTSRPLVKPDQAGWRTFFVTFLAVFVLASLWSITILIGPAASPDALFGTKNLVTALSAVCGSGMLFAAAWLKLLTADMRPRWHYVFPNIVVVLAIIGVVLLAFNANENVDPSVPADCPPGTTYSSMLCK